MTSTSSREHNLKGLHNNCISRPSFNDLMRHGHPFVFSSSVVVHRFVSHFASTSHLHVALHPFICGRNYNKKNSSGKTAMIVTKSDYLRWIGTSAMLSDCSSKTMTSSRLNETLSTGIFDMRPTEESLVIKVKNRKWRASKKEEERLQDLDD